jgi:hypothetical protein
VQTWADFFLEGENEKVHMFCRARYGSYDDGMEITFCLYGLCSKSMRLESLYSIL